MGIDDVPRSTLHDRISGKVQFGSHSRPESYLSDTEEAELMQFLLKMARIGYAKLKKQVLALVEAILMKKWNIEEVRVT